MTRMIIQLKKIVIQENILLRLFPAFVFLSCLSLPAGSQVYNEHDENFAFEVKQIDEFFERFNDEKTLIKEYISKNYNNTEVTREDLIKSLFNRKSANIKNADVSSFIKMVDNPERPVKLSFYDDDWYARVKCSVVYEEKERELFLLMRVQKENNGACKWVVHNVYAEFLKTSDGSDPDAFLNPVSHATDFMALDRAFKDTDNLKAYLSSGFQDDQLSKFVIEMQKNRITFRHVENISYHFFQVDGWIFSVENFQRKEKNSGWLISRLIKAEAKEKEDYKRKLLRQKI